MSAPNYLLDHPPVKVSIPFGELSALYQEAVMNLMTLLWCTDSFDVPDRPRIVFNDLPPGLHVSPVSKCFTRGLTGHVAMVKNRRGRGMPLTEEFFLTCFPHTLAVGLHSTFLEPQHSTTLCVVTAESASDLNGPFQ